jgi:hypothetical protein
MDGEHARSGYAFASGAGALDLRVRLLPEPGLWCWEIVHRGGPLVRSSWAAEWNGYVSSEEALAAGRAYLAKLESLCTSRGRAADGSRWEAIA